MKSTTASVPMIAAFTPLRIESWPSDGSTARSSMIFTGASSGFSSTLASSNASVRSKLPEISHAALQDRLVDERRRVQLAVQHDGQLLPHVARVISANFAPPSVVEAQVNLRLVPRSPKNTPSSVTFFPVKPCSAVRRTR